MDEYNKKLHRRGKYADPSPYPEIKVTEPNLYYASLIMDDYAGIVSEFTAISQYLYHSFFFKDIDKELGELLENVAINEMLHMEILADTIRKLGGNPQMRGSYSTHHHFWHGGFVVYGNELCEQIKADIEAEYRAIDGYKKHIRMIDDPFVKAILSRIILDEMVHFRLFNQAIYQHCGKTYKPLK